MAHVYTAPDGRAYTTPDELYIFRESYADAPAEDIADEGTLPELCKRHVMLRFLGGDESLLYEPVVLNLTIGLVNVTLRPKGWD